MYSVCIPVTDCQILQQCTCVNIILYIYIPHKKTPKHHRVHNIIYVGIIIAGKVFHKNDDKM